MSVISFKGNTIHTAGTLPAKGTRVPDALLTDSELADKRISDYRGKKIVLNIFPSIDTSVCAQSVRRFNQEASVLDDTVVLCISRDLPFAQKRFCAAEGLDDVITLSAMRDTSFGDAYGVAISDGPMASLFSRAVVVLDETQRVVYSQQVPDIGQEPDYAAALGALKNI